MYTNNFLDLVVSCAEKKNFDSWLIAMRKIRERHGTIRVIVSVPDADYLYFTSISPNYIEIFKDSEIIAPEVSNNIVELARRRSGWYIQQFIKMQLLYNNLLPNQVGLIWDADTIPFKNLDFFDNKEHKVILYTSNSEYHLPYFEQIYRLTGMDKKCLGSFIAQFIVVKNEWIQSLINELGGSEEWLSNAIASIDWTESSGFSEYELLGTFVASRFPADVVLHDLSNFVRNGNSKLGGVGKIDNFIIRFIRRKVVLAAFESWDPIESIATCLFQFIISTFKTQLKRLLFFQNARNRLASFSKSKFYFFQKNRNSLSNELSMFFSLPVEKRVIQVGANDGVQNDFLRIYIAKQQPNCNVLLIEPLPFYCNILENLYKSRSDVKIENVAIGSDESYIRINYINPQIAEILNGDGPENNWAHGQGSFSRAKVVQSIFQNSFRGEKYVEQIPFFISNIQSCEVKVIPLKSYLKPNCNQLLVIDVQGYEMEVLKSMGREHLPNLIIIENEFEDERILDFLSALNYKQILDGHDLIFSLQN